ncbi:hypothetical protein [uncultured Tateyamaria sp.]|uniref:hypothetical protein n=1 Tax=uncultured Tateyamaria sp. TaxID=455651 RepID=UPI002610E80F|nr:hypothetical protein [uncultured Tateyamaria sp.]
MFEQFRLAFQLTKARLRDGFVHCGAADIAERCVSHSVSVDQAFRKSTRRQTKVATPETEKPVQPGVGLPVRLTSLNEIAEIVAPDQVRALSRHHRDIIFDPRADCAGCNACDFRRLWYRAAAEGLDGIDLNRPLFAGDPEARILGYGKEELWKAISGRTACACCTHDLGSRARMSKQVSCDFIGFAGGWMPSGQLAHHMTTRLLKR